jgi:hypothetical protein
MLEQPVNTLLGFYRVSHGHCRARTAQLLPYAGFQAKQPHRRKLDAEALAALGATGSQHRPAALVRHARKEAVTLSALTPVGLISPFHMARPQFYGYNHTTWCGMINTHNQHAHEPVIL